MGHRSSRNALSRQRTRFCTTLVSTSKLVPTGIIHISVRCPISFAFDCHLTCLAATQYCDGLRGVFILDDPDGPYKHLYDVDDGVLLHSSVKEIDLN